MTARRLTAADASQETRVTGAKEVLRTLRKSRSTLENLQQHHAAAYVDIAVQLLKQAIADQTVSESDDD